VISASGTGSGLKWRSERALYIASNRPTSVEASVGVVTRLSFAARAARAEPARRGCLFASGYTEGKHGPMRKYIVLAVGLLMMGGGLWWASALFDVISFPIWMVIGSAFLLLLGAPLVWVTLREWRQVKS
jgi:hypothetical protein